VVLLMASFMSGFSGESNGLLLGQVVAGTPTVGITGGAPGTGTEITGQVVGVDTLQTPPVVLLATTAGQTYVVLADPSMATGLGIGVTVIFFGEYVAADVFNAYQVLGDATVGSSELALGAPLTGSGTPTPIVLGATIGDSDNSNSSSSSSDCSSGSSNGNSSDCATATPTLTPTPTSTPTPKPTKTPTPTPDPKACSDSQTLTISPQATSTTAGKSVSVHVTVAGSGSCAGKRVYLDVTDGPNRDMPLVSAALDGSNQATLSYSGAKAGKDTAWVWLDTKGDAIQGPSEPAAKGTYTWAAPTPTVTPTPTPKKK
jgi:hypothetical protein